MTLTDVLTTCFVAQPCDFCPASGPVYIDPETELCYCLPCLAEATDPANALPDLPPTEADEALCREVVAEHRAGLNAEFRARMNAQAAERN